MSQQIIQKRKGVFKPKPGKIKANGGKVEIEAEILSIGVTSRELQ